MESKHVKIFSGSAILVNGLQALLEEVGVKSLFKDHVNSANMAGFGSLGKANELFILESDMEKATPILESYKLKINS